MKYLEEVKAAVRKASGLMLTGDFDVEQKDGYANIVTSSDIAVQEQLCRDLSALIPGCGFICEEEDMNDDTKEYVWVIDPIDGTANYARGIDSCAISVGLRRNGENILGVIYMAAKDEMYWAAKGEGAFCNGKPIHASTRPFADGLFCGALCTYHKEFAHSCALVMEETFLRCNDIRRFGAATVELCMLAKGQADLYFEMRLLPWDYAAGMLILQEAGGVITNLSGEEPSFKGPDIVVAANSVANYDELMGIIRNRVPVKPYDR